MEDLPSVLCIQTIMLQEKHVTFDPVWSFGRNVLDRISGPVAKIFLVMCYVLCFCKNNWRHCRKVESSLDHRRRILSRDLYVTPELIYMAISCEDGALLYYAVNISSDDGALSNEDGTLLYEVGAFYVKVFFI